MLLARALLLLLAFVLLSPSAWAQETRDIQILVDGTPRRALLVNNFGPGQAVPVVIVLHGGMGSAEAQRERTGCPSSEHLAQLAA